MIQAIERRIVNLHKVEIKRRDVQDGQAEVEMFTGYAAVFYNADNPGTEYQLFDADPDRGIRGLRERIMPGTFDRCLSERQDVRGLFNHDPNIVLGRCGSGSMRLSIDKTGLRYEIDYNPDDPDHQRIRAKLQRGDVDGSSFSFRTRDDQFTIGSVCDPENDDCNDIRELRDVDVLDVGPVAFPAYTGTTAGVRAIGDLAEVRCACQAAALENRGVVAYSAGPVIDSDTWDADSALKRIRDWASQGDNVDYTKYRRAFAFFDSADAHTLGAYKLPHHDIRDGKLCVHKKGVQVAMAALLGSRGGTSIPEDAQKGVYSHLQRHYEALGLEAPEFKAAGGDDDDKERAVRAEHDRLRLQLAEAEN